MNLQVPAVEATLGTSVEVKLLDDSVATVDIAPGTQPDATIRLSDKGMPHLRREGHGSLIAHVEVMIPTDLSHKQRDLLEQLREASSQNAGVATKDESHDGFFSRLRSKFGR